MKFISDPESTGYLLQKITKEDQSYIISIIRDSYYPNEAKEIARKMKIENHHDKKVQKRFTEKVIETANSIFDGNYQAYIDNLNDIDYLVIEPEYGFGTIELDIKGILI
jgi:hypothetical protein